MHRSLRKFLFIALILSFTLCSSAQGLPRKIRGYKVHDEILKLQNAVAKTAHSPSVAVHTPTVSDVSLSGISLVIIGEIEEAGYDGRVDMMTFRDFRVNGVTVEVADFSTPFRLHKRGKTALPAPARMFLPTATILNAAWNEITGSKRDWEVTGRVFVFGRFKKFGLSFKRVIPVDITVTITNPLLGYYTKVPTGCPAV